MIWKFQKQNVLFSKGLNWVNVELADSQRHFSEKKELKTRSLFRELKTYLIRDITGVVIERRIGHLSLLENPLTEVFCLFVIKDYI